jgi:hypothetical protein
MSQSLEFNPKDADEEYANLAHYTEVRTREISGMLQPYIEVTDGYGQLIARLTRFLGHIKPRDVQDRVIRNLMAEVFDCLYEARVFILSGKSSMAYTLSRRAYEFLSLLALCTFESSWAERWERGKKISNEQIRKQLAKHKMGEAEEVTKQLYNDFCDVTHPNRDFVPNRLLGEGNLSPLVPVSTAALRVCQRAATVPRQDVGSPMATARQTFASLGGAGRAPGSARRAVGLLSPLSGPASRCMLV